MANFFNVFLTSFSLLAAPGILMDNSSNGNMPELGEKNASLPADFSDRELSDEEMLAFLNQEINSLEKLRDNYLAKAAKFQNQADRLQFKSDSLYEARIYWNLADMDRAAAEQIEENLIVLKEQRDRILQRMQAGK